MALIATRVLCLAGGVGGARMADGLAQILAPDSLTVVVNTADDFRHYGLQICPDLDTVMYTLAGLADRKQGWGLAEDSTQMLAALRRYGESGWFRLGDGDLATHLLRTHWLDGGMRLTEITARLAAALGIRQRVLPMSDDAVATRVLTENDGELDFQTWFVRRRCEPTVRALRLAGIGDARMTPEVATALARAEVILIAPSNPLLSIQPILSLAGMRAALRTTAAPVVGVTPLIRGRALKGPADRLLRQLGHEASAAGVARWYGEVLDGFVYDERDSAPAGAPVWLGTDTVMDTTRARARLAREIIDWVGRQWPRRGEGAPPP